MPKVRGQSNGILNRAVLPAFRDVFMSRSVLFVPPMPDCALVRPGFSSPKTCCHVTTHAHNRMLRGSPGTRSVDADKEPMGASLKLWVRSLPNLALLAGWVKPERRCPGMLVAEEKSQLHRDASHMLNVPALQSRCLTGCQDSGGLCFWPWSGRHNMRPRQESKTSVDTRQSEPA